MILSTSTKYCACSALVRPLLAKRLTVATAPVTRESQGETAPRARVVRIPGNGTEVRVESTPAPEGRPRTVITRRSIFDGDNDDD
jgi:hypothetical protein